MKKSTSIENIFYNINYYPYIVQYEGDIEAEISKKPDFYVTIINDKYAIVAMKKEFVQRGMDLNMSEETSFESIVYVTPAIMFTLQEVSPIEASQARFLQVESSLNLTGKGVNVAIIDSGIDYLNEEFIDANGDTRIDCIWDQTIISSEENESNAVPFGTIYRKNKINDAIKAYKDGKSPYDIVATKDEIGHGTNMSGLIGATGKNPNLKGVAPDCNFVIVKLIEEYAFEAEFEPIVPVYNITSIFAALQFLYEYAIESTKPMVIYFPLGSSFGSHKGNGILDEFINSISTSSGIVVVAGTGNQRDAGGHSSGILSPIVGAGALGAGVIELEVSPEQKHLWVEIWVDYPNIVSLEIVSPSGESTGSIPVIINYTKEFSYIFEKTSVSVNYYFPEEYTGDELIRIRFYNLQPGIWRLRVTGNYILNGKYNAWIPQTGITVGNTRFSFPDPFGTITNPANSTIIVTTAAYNQNNNNLVNYSGMAFLDAIVDRIDIAAGGVNALTVAPNNKTAVVNGTSVSAAVVAGVCAMLFQWGIIDGNDPNIYSQTIHSYLSKGAVKRPGDTTPNPYWGYGMLNVPKIFENML